MSSALNVLTIVLSQDAMLLSMVLFGHPTIVLMFLVSFIILLPENSKPAE